MDHLIQNFVSFPTVPLVSESVIWLWSKMDFSDSIQFHFMDFWMSEKTCQISQCVCIGWCMSAKLAQNALSKGL